MIFILGSQGGSVVLLKFDSAQLCMALVETILTMLDSLFRPFDWPVNIDWDFFCGLLEQGTDHNN